MKPSEVVARLEELRARYVPETIDAARLRLAREVPATFEPFERTVENRLDELRALCDLTRHLQHARS